MSEQTQILHSAMIDIMLHPSSRAGRSPQPPANTGDATSPQIAECSQSDLTTAVNKSIFPRISGTGKPKYRLHSRSRKMSKGYR